MREGQEKIKKRKKRRGSESGDDDDDDGGSIGSSEDEKNNSELARKQLCYLALLHPAVQTMFVANFEV